MAEVKSKFNQSPRANALRAWSILTVRQKMKTVLVTLVCILCAGCFPNLAGDTHLEVLKRMSSPSGKAEAILELVSGGATVSSGYAVHVGPLGFDTKKEDNRSAYIVGGFDKSASANERSVELVWLSADRIVVSSPEFPNLYQNRSTVLIDGTIIHIEWRTRKEPPQQLQRPPSTESVSSLKSPARRS